MDVAVRASTNIHNHPNMALRLRPHRAKETTDDALSFLNNNTERKPWNNINLLIKKSIKMIAFLKFMSSKPNSCVACYHMDYEIIYIWCSGLEKRSHSSKMKQKSAKWGEKNRSDQRKINGFEKKNTKETSESVFCFFLLLHRSPIIDQAQAAPSPHLQHVVGWCENNIKQRR